MLISLSRSVQRAAQPQLLRLALGNAIGFGGVAGPVLFLFALHYNASDTEMGLLYAAIHIAGLSVFLAPLLLNNRETTAIWSGLWWLRGLFCLPYLAVPFLDIGHARVWVIIAAYYGFMVVRALGMTAYFPVHKALCSDRELPGVIARVFTLAHTGLLIAYGFSFLMLRSHLFAQDQWAFLVVISVGIAFNFLTAHRIGKLPRTGYLQDASLGGLWRQIKQALGCALYREVIFLTLLQSALSICVAYFMSYLKNVAKMDSGKIILITVVGMLGAVFVSTLLRVIGIRISSWVLLFGAHALLLVVGLLCAFMGALPLAGVGIHYFVLYALAIIGVAGSGTVIAQLQSSRLPQDQSVQVTIIYQIAAVVSALLTIGAIKAIDYLPVPLVATHGHAYTYVFLLWALLSLGICVFSISMRTTGGRGLGEELSQLSPANLFTLYRAFRLESTKGGPPAKWHVLEGLMLGPTQASRKLLEESLFSSEIHHRYSALRMVNNAPFAAAYPAVLAEAEALDSPLRVEAITSLGFLGKAEAAPRLREFLGDENPAVRSAAIKSLLRLGFPPADEEILEQYRALAFARMRYDIVIGLTETGRRELLHRILASELAGRPGPFWSRALCQSVAETYDKRETMSELFAEEQRQAGAGLEYFLRDFEQPLPAGLAADDLRVLFEQGDYAALGERLRAHLGEEWLTAHDRASALGVLYLWGLEYATRQGKRHAADTAAEE